MIEYGTSEMEYISSKNDVMKELVEKYGHLEMGHIEDIFTSLIIHIISQMLAANAANAIIKRFFELVKEVDPESVCKLSQEEIRKCGISSKKCEYILNLADDTRKGVYDFNSLSEMTDDQVISYLMKIKGVGRWTAEMIAEFTMGRKNIFSFDDVALQNGIMKAHGFKSLSKTRFERMRKLYSPYCSIASLYYYKCNDDKGWISK